MAVMDRVLIADDDPLVRDLLRQIFSDEGYEAVCVGDGAQAKECLSRGAFDILVLDVQMPQFNGFEVLAELRRNRVATPAVMISGSVTATTSANLGALAPAALLAKPIEVRAFLDQVRELRGGKSVPARSLSVLVADDHEGTRAMLEAFLRESGFAVRAVADGAGAIEELARASYDVAVLDVNMPGLRGDEVIERLRRVSPATVPVVITGEATHDQIRHSYREGAVTLLRKPIDLPVLLRVLDGCAGECAERRRKEAASAADARAPVHRKAWTRLSRLLHARPGTPEYRSALTAAVVVVAVACGLLLTRVYLVVQENVEDAAAFQQKMENTAKKMEDYMEWDKRHKEELSGKRPEHGGPLPK